MYSVCETRTMIYHVFQEYLRLDQTIFCSGQNTYTHTLDGCFVQFAAFSLFLKDMRKK